MQKEQITIKIRVDIFGTELTTRSITAYTDPTFPCLAVHRGIEHQSNVWYVTHIKSGYRINPCSFAKRKQALAYATEVTKLTDWTQNVKHVLDQHIDHELVKAYSKAIAV